MEESLAHSDPLDFKCSTYTKQIQITHLAKGKLFGDYNLEADFDLERRPGEIAEVYEREPYSIVTFNPGKLIHIER